MPLFRAPFDNIIEANCLVTDAVGDFVHVTGIAVAGIYQVTKCDVFDATTMPAIGIIIEKDNPTDCLVQVGGIYETTGLVPDTRYWVGASAELSSTFPTPGVGQLAVAQVVGKAISDTELLLRPEGQAHKLRG